MEEHRERLTLGVDAETKRRLKAAAAARGVSVSVYCRAAIDKELAQDAVETRAEQTQESPAVSRILEYRKKHPTRSGSTMTAVDYIREGREIRDKEMDGWLKHRETSSS